MYSFDEKGNVLVNSQMQRAVDLAKSNRTLSDRARALSDLQFVQFQPIHQPTWNRFLTHLSNMGKEIWGMMKVPYKGSVGTPRGSADLKAMWGKCIQDWISADFQGFNGPLPILEENSMSDIILLMPADGAVIRYLARLERKSRGTIEIYIGPGNAERAQTLTLNGANVIVNPSSHTMSVRISERFSTGINGRFDMNVNTLQGLVRMMNIKSDITSINKVLHTLSRKLKSMDGVWGEDGRFGILGFSQKVPAFSRWNKAIQYDRNFHGNNRELYGDRAARAILEPTDLLPFVPMPERTGGVKWTQPRSL